MKFAILTPSKFRSLKRVERYIFNNFNGDDIFLYDDVRTNDIETKITKMCQVLGVPTKGVPRPHMVADVIVTFYPDKEEKTYN
jgi:hypothetical protein